MSCKDSREMWMKQKDEPIRVAQIGPMSRFSTN